MCGWVRGTGAQAIVPKDQLQIAVLDRCACVLGRRQCADGLRRGLLNERERQCRVNAPRERSSKLYEARPDILLRAVNGEGVRAVV